MAPHLIGLQDASRRPLDTASLTSSPRFPRSTQAKKAFPNAPPSPAETVESSYSSYFPQSPRPSPRSLTSPTGSSLLPTAQLTSQIYPQKPLVVTTKSRFSDFSIDSEETRVRALYQRITAAQPFSYKSVFVDVEEKEDPRPSGIRLKWWLFELLAWTISLGILFVLFLLLYLYDGKKQSDWPSQVFTLNALVALIATMTRVSMMIPITQALSQGKWDWFSKGRQREVRNGKPLGDLEVLDNASRSAFGSLKLLWKLKSWSLPVAGAILMILSLGFDTFAQQVLALEYRHGYAQEFSGSVPHASTYQDITTTSGITGLDISAKAAINNGISSANLTPIQAFCPSGDCSWPTTPTIGVCGACIDISKDIQAPVLETNAQDQPLVLTIGEGSKIILSSSTMESSSINMPIADFNIVSSQNQALANANTTECALWFCLQALVVNQKAGIQNITVTETWNTTSIPSDPSGLYSFNSVPSTLNSASNPPYTITKSTFDAYSSYVSSIINGSVFSTSDGYSYSSDSAEAIWVYLSDLDSWIQRVATSITNHIRSVGFSALLSSEVSPEIQSYNGTVYEAEAFIYVRWVWFSFPAGMVLLSLLYLLASMVHASRSGTHIWKSNPLPLALTEVDPSVKLQGDREMEEYGGVVKNAGKRRVSLNDEDGRWVFRATDKSPVTK